MLSKSKVYIATLVAVASAIVVGQSVTSSLEPVNAQSPDNVTSTILKNAGEDLAAAVDALKNNNVTGAVNEARSGIFYLEMLGIPNCIIDDNQMLQCGFPR